LIVIATFLIFYFSGGRKIRQKSDISRLEKSILVPIKSGFHIQGKKDLLKKSVKLPGKKNGFDLNASKAYFYF